MFSEYTIPVDSRFVVQSFFSLVVKLREIHKKYIVCLNLLFRIKHSL